MALKNNTRMLLANALVELTRKMSFERITVQAICEACGAHRQTFYYYFQDKYELAAWIYYSSVSEALQDKEEHSWEEYMLKAFRGMERNRAFFKKALSETGQNALLSEIEKSGLEIYSDIYKAQTGIRSLDVQTMYALRYHVTACAHMTKRWLLDEPEVTPEEQCERLLNVCPAEIIDVFMKKKETGDGSLSPLSTM